MTSPLGDFDKSVVDEVGHRPWPLPHRPWLMTQTWNDLLFAHWPIDVDRLRELVPRAFDLDLFEGTAWIAVVPFHMTNVGARGLPLLPGTSAFPELNVRTYVRAGDRPGVYFFSLDASSEIAVRAARLLLNLPYFAASMSVESKGPQILYRSVRRSSPAAEFEAAYEPVERTFSPRAGTLEYFLTERYCLYNIDRRGMPYRLDIHHAPWRLQVARAHLTRNGMAMACGAQLPDREPLLHFAKRQDTLAWGREPLK